MAVLVINERSSAFHWTTGKRGQGDKQIAPGEIMMLSDSEWNEVPSSFRGPTQGDGSGGMRVLELESLSVTNVNLMDYDVDGNLIYLGEAPEGSDVLDSVWTIKKFTQESIAAQTRITEIQVLNDVAWADRVTLPWV